MHLIRVWASNNSLCRLTFGLRKSPKATTFVTSRMRKRNLNAYQKSLREEHSFSFYPGLLCLAGSVIFMTVSCFLYWPEPEVAFLTDNSPVAWLSSAQLWAMALLALRLWRESVLPRALCIWLNIAMMEMAFDEQFMLHEHWKYGCKQWLTACSIGWVTELPMILVGVLGVVTAAWIHYSLANRVARIQLWLAVGIGIFALYLRFTQHPIELLPYKAALLVTAEALFAGMLLGLGRLHPQLCAE